MDKITTNLKKKNPGSQTDYRESFLGGSGFIAELAGSDRDVEVAPRGDSSCHRIGDLGV